MKYIIILTINLFFLSSCKGQSKEDVYLFFDSNSTETYKGEYDTIEYENNVYSEVNTEESIAFYIFEEYFEHKKSNHSIKKVTKKDYKKIKFTSLKYMNKKWEESNLISKRKVFNKVFIVKPSTNNHDFNIYEVMWIEYVR